MKTIDQSPGIVSQVVTGLLSIKPLARFAKHKAREMIIKRSYDIGVPWREKVSELAKVDWSVLMNKLENKELDYPKYYMADFHAYDGGNLNWEAALESEVAALAVHAGIWPEVGKQGDSRLRDSYLEILKQQVKNPPNDILDLGCSIGLSTFALQKTFPTAKITGLDLSPYFLAVADYGWEQREGVDINEQVIKGKDHPIKWIHAKAEATGLCDQSFDLVSISLVCHELPQKATGDILREVHRLLRPGGYLAIMDMNPYSEVYAKMPPYILTLLKSTEPYLDQYFKLDLQGVLVDIGFKDVMIQPNTHRHRTVIGIA